MGLVMLPASFNLDIYRGDTRRWQFRLWQDNNRTVPADLTGCTVVATIRDKLLNPTFQTLLACTVEAPNIVDMLLTADQSRTLPAVGVWDLQITYPSGDINTPLRGAAIVTMDVTNSIPIQPLTVAK